MPKDSAPGFLMEHPRKGGTSPGTLFKVAAETGFLSLEHIQQRDK
jgi:hypothetical protein